MKKRTITVDDEVWRGLRSVARRRRIRRFLDDLARPHVTNAGRGDDDRAMARDEARAHEGLEWIQGLGSAHADP